MNETILLHFLQTLTNFNNTELFATQHLYTRLLYVLLLQNLGKSKIQDPKQEVNCILMTLAIKITDYRCTNYKYPVIHTIRSRYS